MKAKTTGTKECSFVVQSVTNTRHQSLSCRLRHILYREWWMFFLYMIDIQIT